MMSNRMDEFRRKLEEQAKRRSQAREKRRKRRVKANPGKQICIEWSLLYSEKFGESSGLTAADRVLARKLCEDIGYDKASKVVAFAFETWDVRGVPGIPAIKWIYAHRSRLLAEIGGKAFVSKARVDEYEETGEGDGWD